MASDSLIGTIFAQFLLDTSGYTSGLKEAENKGKESANIIETAFDKIGEKLKSVAKIALAAFSAEKIVEYGKEAILLAARVDTLGLVLNVVGRNAGYVSSEMNTFAKSVEKMGITTQAARQSLILMAQSQMDLTKSDALARVAQDAAVIGNINSSEAFERMVYAIKTGQPEMLRTIGLNVQFEASYEKMANKLSKSAGSLTENEKVQARMNAVLEEGVRINGVYEESLGTAGKAILSLDRYFEQIKDKIGSAFQPALKKVVDALTDMLVKITDELDRFIASGGMDKLGQGIADSVIILIKIMGAVGDAVGSASDFMKKWGSVIEGVTTAVLVMGAAFVAVKLAAILDTIIVAGLSFILMLNGITTAQYGCATASQVLSAALMKSPLVAMLVVMGLATMAWVALRNSVNEATESLGDFEKKIANMSFDDLISNLKKAEEAYSKLPGGKIVTAFPKSLQPDELKAEKTKEDLTKLTRLLKDFEEMKTRVAKAEDSGATTIEGQSLKELTTQIDKAEKANQQYADSCRKVQEYEQQARLEKEKDGKVTAETAKLLIQWTQIKKLAAEKDNAALQVMSNSKRAEDDNAAKYTKQRKIAEMNYLVAIDNEGYKTDVSNKQDAEKIKAENDKIAGVSELVTLNRHYAMAVELSEKELTLKKNVAKLEEDIAVRNGTDLATAQKGTFTKNYSAEQDHARKIAELKTGLALDKTKLEERAIAELPAYYDKLEQYDDDYIKARIAAAKQEAAKVQALQAGTFDYIAFMTKQRQNINEDVAQKRIAVVKNIADIEIKYWESTSNYSLAAMQNANANILTIRTAQFEIEKQYDVELFKRRDDQTTAEAKAEMIMAKKVYDEKVRLFEAEATYRKKVGDIILGTTGVDFSPEKVAERVRRINEQAQRETNDLLSPKGAGEGALDVSQIAKDTYDMQNEKFTDMQDTLYSIEKNTGKKVDVTCVCTCRGSAAGAGDAGGSNTAGAGAAGAGASIYGAGADADAIAADAIKKQEARAEESSKKIAQKHVSLFKKMKEQEVNVDKLSTEERAKLAEKIEKKREFAVREEEAKSEAAKIRAVGDYLGVIGDSFETISQMMGKESKERKTFHDISMAFTLAQKAANVGAALVEAAAAVANAAGGGDPYTAVARIAAVVAALGPLFAQAGIMFGGGAGGGGGGVSAADLKAKNYSANTIFGAEAGTVSESLSKATSILKDMYRVEYHELKGIHDAMLLLNSNITGLVTSIIRTGTISSSNTYGLKEWKSGGLESQEAFLEIVSAKKINDKLFGKNTQLGNFVNFFFGKGLQNFNQLGQGLFGGMTTSQAYASGIQTGSSSINTIKQKGVSASQYTDIVNKTSGGWFSDDSYMLWTMYSALDKNVTDLLTKVYRNLGDVLIGLTENLGTDMQNTLNYAFGDIKINLMGLSGDEITKQLSAVFSAMGDIAVEQLFGPIIKDYQQVNEGMMETAIRLVTDKAVVQSVLELTGKSFSGTIPQLLQISEALITLAGGLSNLKSIATTFYENFFSDEEKQLKMQNQLSDVLATMNLSLPDTRAGFRKLVESLDITTEAGQTTYVSLMQMTEMANQYYQATDAAIAKEKEFIDTLKDLIKTIDEWLDSLSLSELSPGGVSPAEWNAQYQQKAEKAFTKSETQPDDIKTFLSYAKDYLSFMQKYTGSGSDYQAIFSMVTDDVRMLRELIVSMTGGTNSGPYLLGDIPALGSGGLTNGLSYAGERGREWVVPTYEPDRTAFLSNIGIDPENISRSIARSFANEASGGSTNGKEIHVHLYIDKKEITGSVVQAIRAGDEDLIKNLKKVAVN